MGNGVGGRKGTLIYRLWIVWQTSFPCDWGWEGGGVVGALILMLFFFSSGLCSKTLTVNQRSIQIFLLSFVLCSHTMICGTKVHLTALVCVYICGNFSSKRIIPVPQQEHYVNIICPVFIERCSNHLYNSECVCTKGFAFICLNIPSCPGFGECLAETLTIRTFIN